LRIDLIMNVTGIGMNLEHGALGIPVSQRMKR
jgi:hypothetical protein